MASTASLPPILAGHLDHVGAVARARTGKRPSPATIWRWCRRGVAGGRVRLAAVYHSGYWQTTAEAFDAFLAAQTEAALARPGDDLPTASDDDLRAAGLL